MWVSIAIVAIILINLSVRFFYGEEKEKVDDVHTLKVKIVTNMLMKKKTLDEIVELTGLTKRDVKTIVAHYEENNVLHTLSDIRTELEEIKTAIAKLRQE